MQIYKVGGAVRDRLLGRPVSDVDWVVVGASAEAMHKQGFKPVGGDFPVFLHPQTGEEYALARTERKSGKGYGGFVFHASPEVTLEDDLARRDLTINAMAEDDSGNVVDPYGGRLDLDARLLRHVSPAFAEDPLRVLRVARFAARYAPLGFRIAGETLELMRQLAESGELEALTAERSWKEISRALMEPSPQVFIEALRDCGALARIFPELDTLSAGHLRQALARLQSSAAAEHPLTVRWACLLQDLAAQAICTINQRLKAPRECQELAQLSAQYLPLAQESATPPAAALLDLLQRFDVYRRPSRFEEFLAVCRLQPPLCGRAELFEQAAEAARAVAIQPLIERGLQGAELGEALKAERLAAIATLVHSG
ncbi:multifunctional CCA addition/repair protein [Pseudomonas sp. LRF_L74]|uniref:multifunctional CCA addition/repair protein n=1 Tax=Pseudomonas sp. LRF_L74 TaxID=3369422 RepID=UPI003F636A4A